MLACIELRGRVHSAASRGFDHYPARHATRNILDEIVRFYLEAERSHEAVQRANEEAERAQEAGKGVSVRTTDAGVEKQYKAPPLRQAIIAACLRLGTRQDKIGDASNDWYKDIGEAWNYEQQHDALRPKVGGSGLPTSEETYHELRGWKVTRRIERVIGEVMALECDFPADVEKALWILRKMEQHESP
jgi:hypothetical protein